MKITSSVSKCEENSTLSFIFHFENREFRSQVIFNDPFIISMTEWTHLLEAMNNTNRSYHLQFYQEHVNCSIKCTDKEIIFNTTSNSNTGIRMVLAKYKYGRQMYECLYSLLKNEIVVEYLK